MRILIINTLYPPLTVGGAERSVCLLAEALARSGDCVSVVTLHPGSEEIVEKINTLSRPLITSGIASGALLLVLAGLWLYNGLKNF